MSTSACPKCHDEVTIPPGAPRHAQVRCPWCHEEFELSDVLDRLPPMLEVVSAPRLAPSANGEGGEFGFAGEDAYGSPDATQQESSPAFDFGGGGGAATATAPSRPRTSKTTTTARPKRKQKSPVGEVIKVALGGVVGLFLAQMILWWLPGEWRRDPLELGPKVGAYAPWIVPAEYRSANSQGGAATGANGATQEPTLNTQNRSQLAFNSQATRNTAGGSLGDAFEANMQRSQQNSEGNAPTNGSTSGEEPLFGGGATPSQELELPKLPDSALEIPEPDLSLDPAAALGDPLASAAPSSEKMPQETPPNPELPPPGSDPSSAPESDTVAEPPAPTEPTPSEPAPSEPAPSEPAKPEPAPKQPAEKVEVEPVVESAVGVVDAPKYTSDVVTEALNQAAAAEQAFFAADASADAGPQYYTALTELAEKLTYADPAADTAELATQAQTMLSQGKIVDRARLLITQGPARLAATKEDRPNNGIVLFGQVESVEKQGELFESRLKMPGATAAIVPVFSQDEPAYKPGARVIVLGAVVDDPKQQLAGYSGGLPSVVWLGESVILQP